MTWKDDKKRNYDNISLERIRKDVDPIFCELHDTLEEAYYKNWKFGKSKPWQGYDVLPTAEESKTQFDKLHGTLWHLHSIAVAEKNKELVSEYQYDDIRYDLSTKAEESRAWLDSVDIDQSILKHPIEKKLRMTLPLINKSK